jgi:hypothetical protein
MSKNIYVDCTKLSVIAKTSRWSRGLGFQKQAKDEVVIVTDAKLEIVFASHNMTKMNGYVEERSDRKKPKNVSRSFF